MGLFGFGGTNKNVTCPYCMDVVSRDNLKYTCKKCGMEYPSTIKVQSCATKNCGGLLELKCPTCDKELPATIFQFDEYIKFCIVGQTACGKTNYITVMLEEFKQKLNKKMLIAPMNFETSDIQVDHVDYLYKRKIELPATPSGYMTPQLWQITDRTKYNKMKESYKVYSLNIFDGAGEDYLHMTDDIRRYINGSDYIFFLVDPLNLPEVRKQLGLKSDNQNSSDELVKGMAQYLRMGFGLPAGKRIDKPVAVVLTKFDMIMGLMGSAQVTQENDASYSGDYMKSDADAIDSEIRSWLESIGESYFLSALDINFKKTRFFGVSSYGHAPTTNGVGTLMPHRVLDPVMWVLANEKIIK